MDIITDDISNNYYYEENKLIREPARLQLLRRIISYHNNNDVDNNWCHSSTTTNWFELQAIKKNMIIQDFQVQFQQRINDMETSLSILHNSLPHHYDEILSLTDKFLIAAEWIRCDYFKPFIQMFPQWLTWGKGFENIVQYVETVEDMKITYRSEFPQSSEDISSYLSQIQEILEYKRYLYGDIIKQSGLSWKALGLPVDENWFNSTKQWLFGLAFHCSEMMNNVLNKEQLHRLLSSGDTQVTKTMEDILNYIKIISNIVELAGSTNTKLLLSSTMIATSYVNLCLSQIDKMENKVRSVEIRMMHICENISRLLCYLRVIQDMDEQYFDSCKKQKKLTNNINNIYDTIITNENYQQRPYLGDFENFYHLKIIENFASMLVETGLKLCEHITKPKTNTITGGENFVYMYSEFVLKFVNRVIEYFGTEKEFEIRMKPLIASLNKK